MTKKEFEDGFQERRTDTVSVRLALLEKCAADADRRHEENKKSLIAVHVRLSDIQLDFASALSKGIDAVIDKTDAQTKSLTAKMDAQIEAYGKRSERIATLENITLWLERAGYGRGLWLAATWAWIIHHGDKAR